MREMPSLGCHPVNRSVLQVRHLPPIFSEAECSSFLKAHGAVSVAVPGRGKAFASFASETDARRAMASLHQLQLNDRLLLVTFARSNHNIPVLPPVEPLPVLSSAEVNERAIRRIHAIAPHLGLDYILNPMVKYKYPPLTDSILANICGALRDSANFYTQVLHLMNKMNMRAPFQRCLDPKQVFGRTTLKNASTCITSESGSDLSQDDQPITRWKRQQIGFDVLDCLAKKKVRRPKRAIPTAELLPKQKPKEVTECFESAARIRKLQLPSTVGMAPSETTTVAAYTGAEAEVGFGLLKPTSPAGSSPEPAPRYCWSSSFTDVALLERISKQDTVDHPAFRNYDEGNPCVRLYIKNVSKAVAEDDLFRLFGQFVPDDEAERAIFDIRLMKTGRMRGQAFVTFGSVPTAHKALQATNRILLQGKPIVVQFARQNSA